MWFDVLQGVLTAADTSTQAAWREQDRQWRQEDRQWRSEDSQWRQREAGDRLSAVKHSEDKER